MMPPDDARRGLVRSPAQWEAEALALVEEADARDGAVAGALRYAAARLFEEGVGDVAAAMDHLRLALEEPAETTFRPVLALAAPARRRGGKLLDGARISWTSNRRRPATPVRAPTWRSKKLTYSNTGWTRRRGPSAARGGARRAARARGGLAGASRRARFAASDAARRATPRFFSRSSNDDWRRRVRRRARAAALPAGAHRERSSGPAPEALGLWLRAHDEAAGRGAAALRRAGARRVAAALGKFSELGRVVGMEAEASAGVERAGWLALGAAPPATGWARRRAPRSHRGGATGQSRNPALLFAAVSNALSAGEWKKAREALNSEADLSRGIATGRRRSWASARTWPSCTRRTTTPRPAVTGDCSRCAPAIRSRSPRWSGSPPAPATPPRR